MMEIYKTRTLAVILGMLSRILMCLKLDGKYHDVYLSGNLMYILLKNLDVNISGNLDVSVASFNM